MSGIPYSSPSVQFLDPVTDLPLASGKVYTYLTTTVINKTTYSDIDLKIKNRNPIRLDADGRAQIFLDTDALYTFKIDRSNDTTVRTEDDVGFLSATTTEISGAEWRLNSDQTIGTGTTGVVVSWGNSIKNVGGIFQSGGAPTRLTIPTGFTQARFLAHIKWESGSSPGTRAQFWKNGTNIMDSSVNMTISVTHFDSTYLIQSVRSPWLPVAVADYFELKVDQSSGTDKDIRAAGSFFEVEAR